MRQDLNLRPLRPEGSHLSFKTFFGVFYKIILDYLSKFIRAFLFIFTIFFREIFVNRKSFVINSWELSVHKNEPKSINFTIKMRKNQSISQENTCFFNPLNSQKFKLFPDNISFTWFFNSLKKIITILRTFPH